MKRLPSLSFNGLDFVINGKPLLDHLQKHERVNPDSHIPSVLGMGEIGDLTLSSEPNLAFGKHALYLCSMCGGFDGNPIGMTLLMDNDYVTWSEIGYWPDHDDESCILRFEKVSQLKFRRAEYDQFLKQMTRYA